MQIATACRPHLHLHGWRTPGVVGRRAVAIDERHVLRGAVAMQDCGEPKSVHGLAGVVEGELRGRREAGSGCTPEPDHRPENAEKKREAHQWFTWCSSMKTVQPSEDA
jgi:hypothetical protein